MNNIVIIGAGGHGKVAADIAEKSGYTDIVFLDDNKNVSECAGYPVVGKTAEFADYSGDYFVAVGNAKVRRMVTEQLEACGKRIVSLIHPSAVVARGVQIGCGTLVAAGAVINPGTVIGKSCIINTCSSVDHDCEIGVYSHVAVGAHICGTVFAGDEVWVGAGATVINNISVCDGVLIGAGAVVVNDISESGMYIGVPAKKKHENISFC